MAMRIRYLLCFCLLSGFLAPQKAFATHLRAGEITVQRISCSSLTFRITLTFFLDTEKGVKIGGDQDWLSFGDGEKMLVPIQETKPRPDLGKHMGMVIFTTDYTYSALNSEYTISYSEPMRNEQVVNMDQSDNTLFYVETKIYLDPTVPCNQYLPRLRVPPIDRACTGVAFFHNPGAFDLDFERDSLSYEISVPMRAFNTTVFNYKDPNDPKFYLNFQNGNENKNGVPTFSINPQDGTLKWDAPGRAGEYNIAFHIIEWRKDVFGVWRKVSYVTRDMQIIVDDCDNNRPDLIVPDDTCVVAGTVLDKTIFGIDPDNDQVKIEVFSDVLHLNPSPAEYFPNPPVLQPSAPPARLRFTWKTSCEHVKEQYYFVVFKITDSPPNDTKLVTFKTWRIKVIGPAPGWERIDIASEKRNATLTWDPYTCANATKMQVWRRIDETDYSPMQCETGMPGSLGYSLIGTVTLAGSGNQFTDTNDGIGLAPGARYCYRLVAVFPGRKGAESYVSLDTCLAPILADAPVITHVTVENTHAQAGAIRISWRSPFEIDKTQFPGPYTYEIFRGTGFNGTPTLRVTPVNQISDTTFVDVGIDTENEVYNYTIVLYSNIITDPSRWAPVDTSATASSVQLKAHGNDGSIFLNWKAEVPWSNVAPQYPYHLIYRGEEKSDPGNFMLIDSIVAQPSGFLYTDTGTFGNTPLDKDQTYCYRIVTRGTYGNPLINSPSENYSQMVCLKPGGEDKLCAPILSLASVSCNEVFASSHCTVKEFVNTIQWHTLCGSDVRSYNVYAAAETGGDFLLIAENVRDTFYTDRNLPSFARCYKVIAVDSNDNEGDESEIICNDNCPYFELPNIFTPNGDECNDVFSAYGPFNPFNQDAPESCLLGNDNYSNCIRFVEKVAFRVYNRWGKEVYSYRSGKGESSVYINWDGKDNQGQWLTSGIYYYKSDVTFNVLDPDKKQQIIKGWVHLVR
jgi:hypothetical protein